MPEFDPIVMAVPEPIKRMMFAEAPIIEFGVVDWTEEAA